MASNHSDSPNDSSTSFWSVLILGALLLLAATAIALLAQSFPYEKSPGRPIREVVALSWLASGIALFTIFQGLRVPESRRRSLVGSVFVIAVAVRVILVFSNPILEVDFYRYLWDGMTANQGVSPYRYSPDAILNTESADSDLTQLQEYVAEHPSARTIVSRVHFEKFTTLYPPVSQFVFRTTTALIPDDASVWLHIVGIKSMLVLFDIGVIFCLAWIIRVLGKHPAWLIAYGWNPLVLKEVANGGHLDSIAVFFFTAGISVCLWIVKNEEQSGAKSRPTKKKKGFVFASFSSGALLGLGIGAKLYPIVLVPAIAFFLWSKGRLQQAVWFVAACTLISASVLWPMIHQQVNNSKHVSEPVPTGKTSDGLAVFMTHWRMNDAVFSFVYQNVEYDWGGKDPAWYVFVPNELRTRWCEQLIEHSLANGNPAYFVSRIVTVAVFGVFYLWILFKLRRVETASDLANCLFLIMGVFFFLQPTQNPWYWLWAMPLVCFAKNRGWLFVSMALFVYYIRFWFEETNGSYEFQNVNYVGVDFYDHCVVWIEFLSIVSVLAVVHVGNKVLVAWTSAHFYQEKFE